MKISKGAKIRNRRNQVPHLAQDTNGKVTNSQLDSTHESQEGSHEPTLMQICIFYRYRPILKALGQFENLVLEIMTTRRNIRRIARTPFRVLAQFRYFIIKLLTFGCVQIYQYHSKEGKSSHQHTTAIVFLSPNESNGRNGNGICDYLHAG